MIPLRWPLLAITSLFINAAAYAADASNTAALYTQHCASCHGEGRLGAIGPALLPQNMGRLKPSEAAEVIGHGRAATQMQGFGNILNAEQIQSLVKYIFTPPSSMPAWGLEQIQASHLQHANPAELPDQPRYRADMDNLFLVVEIGDHHITLLDGNKFEPIHRFPTRFALHGGPKYSPEGRFVYLISRDGWVSKYDLYNLQLIAEVRAGINARNIAVSDDGRYLMVANYLPNSLVLLDAATLKPIKLFEAIGLDGTSSRVSAVYTAPPRNSFIAALKDIPEAWEISYADNPPAGFSGWVHDYREESGDVDRSERFPLRRISLTSQLDDFFFDQNYITLIGSSRDGNSQAIDLDTRRKVGELAIPGMPHLASGITFQHEGRTVLATPNLKEGVVSVIDMQTWKTIKRIETLGPGFFMRSHDKTPYAWVDVFFGPNKDVMHVINKGTLEIEKTLRPAPGKTAAHVEFTNDGRYALVSIWEMDGALVIYDANTLEEVKRLPMKKPSGKYNVYNKTKYVAGTSH